MARGLGSGGRLNLLLEGRISLRRLCDRVELLRVQPLLLNGCKHQGLLAFFWYGCVSLDLLQLYSRFRKFLTISIADISGCLRRTGWRCSWRPLLRHKSDEHQSELQSPM